MMITILAEKPDVGMKIAAALDRITLHNGSTVSFKQLKTREKAVKAQQNKDGFLKINFRGTECYVTWGFGHLATLKQAKDYNPDYANWRKMPIPFFPDTYEIKLIQFPEEKDKYGQNEKIKRQFQIIKKLMSKSEYVINATDYDREGEVIFSYIYELAGCRKPVKRACFSSQTKGGIQEGFTKNLIDGSKMKNLETAGRMRAIADAAVGYNVTAAMTLKNTSNDVLSVGRVQTPTLAMIVNRELQVTGFAKSKYYTITANFADLKTELKQYTAEHSERKFEKKEDAERIMRLINGKNGVVTNFAKVITSKAVPNLYSLSTLQMDANALFGFTLKETLDIAQTLYDGGFTTYPRTNSQFLTEDMVPTVNAVLDSLATTKKYGSLISSRDRNFDSKHFFDDAKVESHFAIIPTGVIPEDLDEKQSKVYDLIAKSVIRMLYPPAKIERTAIETTVVEEKFISHGSRIVDEGWMCCGRKIKEQDLPNMEIGEKVTGEYFMDEKETAPPKRYTDKSILTAMLSAGKELTDKELKKAMETLDVKGIGTEATRANIIDTLLHRGYIERKGKTIYATQKGIDIIQALPVEDIKSAALTAQWEIRLDEIAKGKEDPLKFQTDIEAATKAWCDTIMHSSIAVGTTDSNLFCPLCGKPIKEHKWGWGCSGYSDGCHFSVSRTIAGKNLTLNQVQSLLQNGETKKLKGFISKKTGDKFEAKLFLDHGKVKFKF